MKTLFTCLLVSLVLPLFAQENPEHSTLSAAYPDVPLDSQTAVRADLNLDGKEDIAFLGKKDKQACVAALIQPNTKSRICFPEGDSPGSLCAVEKATLSVEKDDGKLNTPDDTMMKIAGCKNKKVDKACRPKMAALMNMSEKEYLERESGKGKKYTRLVLKGGQCDAYRLTWDKKKSVLTWKR